MIMMIMIITIIIIMILIMIILIVMMICSEGSSFSQGVLTRLVSGIFQRIFTFAIGM